MAKPIQLSLTPQNIVPGTEDIKIQLTSLGIGNSPYRTTRIVRCLARQKTIPILGVETLLRARDLHTLIYWTNLVYSALSKGVAAGESQMNISRFGVVRLIATTVS